MQAPETSPRLSRNQTHSSHLKCRKPLHLDFRTSPKQPKVNCFYEVLLPLSKTHAPYCQREFVHFHLATHWPVLGQRTESFSQYWSFPISGHKIPELCHRQISCGASIKGAEFRIQITSLPLFYAFPSSHKIAQDFLYSAKKKQSWCSHLTCRAKEISHQEPK